MVRYATGEWERERERKTCCTALQYTAGQDGGGEQPKGGGDEEREETG